MKIHQMTPGHYPEVLRIYQEGIETGNATFEQAPPGSWQSWSEKFLSTLSIVCVEYEKVIGWAALSRVSSRAVYQGVGEISVYVAIEHQGKGIGKELMNELVCMSEEAGFWTLQAGIFPENIASVNLHKKAGFRIVGKRHKIGIMTYGPEAGKWRDVVLMERRSENTDH